MAYPLKTGNAKLCGGTLHQSQADNVFLVRNIVSRKSRFEKRSRVLAAHRQIKGDILSAGLPAVKIDKLDSKTVFVP
ncbi:hypothetical protein CGT72_18125 [Vibrio cholerae]|nr:hypothetical protein [Vibrio cholerae]PAR97002.1 hypothetical protein CGT81_12530 [Vibrio cholerae]PAS27475.1 hypothetical protein CGT72_18125 [Vibrio cholerae]